MTNEPDLRDEEDRGRKPTRRAFLQGVFAVSLASYARLSGAPRVARYARTVMGRKQEPDPPFLTCDPIDLCGACACAGDRYRCTCSDGSMTYKTCAAGYDCASFTLPTCDQSG